MGLFQHFDTDTVATVTITDGCQLRLRSPRHPKVVAMNRHQGRKYRAYLNSRAPWPEEIDKEFQRERMSVYIEDWHGPGWTDRDGNPLPFTPDNLDMVIRELPDFVAQVVRLHDELATFQKQELAELGKSSATSSGSTSSTPDAATSSAP